MLRPVTFIMFFPPYRQPYKVKTRPNVQLTCTTWFTKHQLVVNQQDNQCNWLIKAPTVELLETIFYDCNNRLVRQFNWNRQPSTSRSSDCDCWWSLLLRQWQNNFCHASVYIQTCSPKNSFFYASGTFWYTSQ